eukprot:TRINITY_DN28068_c0_g1_i1.p1 TRINITY_DN28068_c0_g1~~TRINITY_DN28068_c0_g1_i1.p1  ORF type:complete len:362 (+),score=27.25 TRINITY_DN28068_c0_g1_i1:116-1201(+)
MYCAMLRPCPIHCSVPLWILIAPSDLRGLNGKARQAVITGPRFIRYTMNLVLRMRALLLCLHRKPWIPWPDIALVIFPFVDRVEIPHYDELCAEKHGLHYPEAPISEFYRVELALIDIHGSPMVVLKFEQSLQLRVLLTGQLIGEIRNPCIDAFTSISGIPGQPQFIAYTTAPEPLQRFSIEAAPDMGGKPDFVLRQLSIMPMPYSVFHMAVKGDSVALTGNDGKVEAAVWDGLFASDTGVWHNRWVRYGFAEAGGVAFTRSDDLLVSCRSHIALLSRDSGVPLRLISGPAFFVQDLCTDAVGNVLVCSCSCASVYVYDWELCSPPRQIPVHNKVKSSIGIAVHGRTILVRTRKQIIALHA